MQRDMDLIRKIMLKIEQESSTKSILDLRIAGYTLEEVAYHCKLLDEHNFIRDYKAIYGDNELNSFIVGTLTWEGHDFIDSIRDDSFWNKLKDYMKSNGVPLMIETIKEVVPIFVKKMLEL